MDDVVEDYNDIFSITSPKILKDAQILSLDYIPVKLIGRTKEIRTLAQIFDPLKSKGYPSNCLIFGKTGTGKTVVIKFLLKKLLEKVTHENLLSHPLKWVYISCKTDSSTNDVLYAIIKAVDPLTNIPKKGYSLSYYYSFLWNLISEQNISLIIVLDEIDYLKSDEVLYNFSRVGESGHLPLRHFLTTIGISNDLHYDEALDQRVVSSMRFKDIIFDPYNSDQITAILYERAKLAFYDNSIADGTVEYCAARSAKEHGDARKAIELLSSAATYAERNNLSQVIPEHIDIASNTLAIDRPLAVAVEFPTQNKLILLTLLKLINSNRVSTTTSIAYLIYTQMCQEIDVVPLHRTTISNMIGELELLGFIATKVINKGRRGGRKRIIELAIDNGDMVEEALYRDYNLDRLRSFEPKMIFH